MKNIEDKNIKIDTSTSSKNFAKDFKLKKTYFLNGVWGSGKTEYLQEFRNFYKKEKLSNHFVRFVNLKLWEQKGNNTVNQCAFDKCACVLSKLKYLLIVAVPITIMSTTQFRWMRILGFQLEDIPPTVVLLSIITAIFILSWKFINPNPERIYTSLLKIRVRLGIRRIIFIIDDFDRLDEETQLETYQLFNLLHKKVTFIFVGNYYDLVNNEKERYLQKIIDKKISLPHCLHPKNIWQEYFEQLKLSIKTIKNVKTNDLAADLIENSQKSDEENMSLLQCLFIAENRVIREQIHFHDYVRQEFYERKKLGKVQPVQQLMIIYLYLFYPEIYDDIEKGGFPQGTIKNDFNVSLYNPITGTLNGTVEDVAIKILDGVRGYPRPFVENREAYYIREEVRNLTIEEINMLIHDRPIKLFTKQIENSKIIDIENYLKEISEDKFIETGELVLPYAIDYIVKTDIDNRLISQYQLAGGIVGSAIHYSSLKEKSDDLERIMALYHSNQGSEYQPEIETINALKQEVINIAYTRFKSYFNDYDISEKNYFMRWLADNKVFGRHINIIDLKDFLRVKFSDELDASKTNSYKKPEYFLPFCFKNINDISVEIWSTYFEPLESKKFIKICRNLGLSGSVNDGRTTRQYITFDNFEIEDELRTLFEKKAQKCNMHIGKIL